MTKVLLGGQNVQVRVTSLSIGGLQALAEAEAALVAIATERAAAEAAEAAAVIARSGAEQAETGAEDARDAAEGFSSDAALSAGSAALTALAVGFFPDAASAVPGAVADGDYYWTDYPSDLTMMAYYQNVGGIATAVEDINGDPITLVKTLGFLTDGDVGDLYTRADTGTGPTSPISRPNMSLQPSGATDLTDTAQYQVKIWSALTNPTVRLTASVVSGKRRFTNNQASVYAVAVFNGQTVQGERVYSTAAKVTTVTGSLANIAFGIAVQPTGPTLGAAFGNMTTAAVCLLYRANTGILAVQSDGFTSAPGVTITDTQGDVAWTAGQLIRCDFTPDVPTGVSGWVRWYADGEAIGSTYVSGLPANAYVAQSFRFSDLNNVVELDAFETHYASLDVPKRIHLHPDVGAVGGTGTEGNPFQTLTEASESINYDSERRELDIVSKAGIWSNACLEINHSRLRRLSINEVKGGGSILRASTPIDIGAGWVLVSGAVYKIANPGRSKNLRGILEVGRAQSFGRTGSVTIDDRYVYESVAPDTPAASLLPGQCSAQVSGADDGFMYVRMVDDGDPAAVAWRICSQRSPLILRGDGEWQACDLILRGLSLEDGFNYGAQVSRANLLAVENLISRSCMQGFGLDFQDCDGEVNNCWVYGSAADGIHQNDSEFTDPDAHLPCVIFNNCGVEGVRYSTAMSLFGDGFSNHRGNKAILNDFIAKGVGKDGVSTAGDCRVNGLYVEDAYNAGVSMAFYPGVNAYVQVNGGTLINNLVGATVNGGGGGAVDGQLDLLNVWLEDNVEAHLRTEQKGTGADLRLIARRPHFHNSSGVEPTDGNVDEEAGTTITVLGATSS